MAEMLVRYRVLDILTLSLGVLETTKNCCELLGLLACKGDDKNAVMISFPMLGSPV